MNEDSARLCLIVDTNVWRGTYMLRTVDGAALLHFLNRHNGVLALPHVLEREIVKHAVEAGDEALKRVEEGLSAIQRLTRVKPDVVFPDTDFRAAAETRLRELEPYVVRIALSLDHAMAAIDRVNSELPPNGKGNQQFKDSLIWEAIISLGAGYQILFVTADKSFYEQRDYAKGLSHVLSQEADGAAMTVRVFPDITGALDYVKESAVPLDTASIAEVIERDVRDAAAKQLEKHNIVALAERTETSVTAFATESVDVLMVGFELVFQGYEGADLATPTPCTVRVGGVCSYNERTKTVSELRLERLEITSAYAEPRRSVTLFVGAAHLGSPKPIPLELRAPVE